jgi:oligopeptide/dipeptide ABC transporter ATP-binding protein
MKSTGTSRREVEMGTDPSVKSTDGNLLEIRNLKTYFYTEEGVVRAVDGVSVSIPKGKSLGLVGESGSGKTVTALSILRLIATPPGRILEGNVFFEGEDILTYSLEKMQKEIRGNKISMVFQEPMTSLNPVYTVIDQVSEAILAHQTQDKRKAEEIALEMLDRMRIPEARSRARDYPHQFSGGMRQRIMIAMALSCRPALLIADEPTTALDVTIQAQILELMKELKENLNTSILLITHNLGIIAEMADQVAIMYAGQVVEYAGVRTIFKFPRHPYTQALLRCVPRLKKREGKLESIEGTVPDLRSLPPGCRFHNRCREAVDLCSKEEPPLREVEEGHQVRCHSV